MLKGLRELYESHRQRIKEHPQNCLQCSNKCPYFLERNIYIFCTLETTETYTDQIRTKLCISLKHLPQEIWDVLIFAEKHNIRFIPDRD